MKRQTDPCGNFLQVVIVLIQSTTVRSGTTHWFVPVDLLTFILDTLIHTLQIVANDKFHEITILFLVYPKKQRLLCMFTPKKFQQHFPFNYPLPIILKILSLKIF